MLFWLKETTVKRVLIEAPTRAAADAYSMGDECSDYMTSISGSSEAEIVLAGTHPREHGNAPPAPDVTVDAAGTVIEHERDRDDNDSK